MLTAKHNKLCLGAGKDKKTDDDWDYQDIVPLEGIDFVFDLDHGRWPIEDNQYQEIEAKMVLEHLHNWPQAMEEIWRIAKPGATVKIEVPFFPSMYAVIDPTHKSFFAYQTFEYFEPTHSLNYYTKARFNIKRRYIRYSWNKFMNFLPALIFNKFPVLYSRYFAFICPSNSLEVELEVVK